MKKIGLLKFYFTEKERKKERKEGRKKERRKNIYPWFLTLNKINTLLFNLSSDTNYDCTLENTNDAFFRPNNHIVLLG